MRSSLATIALPLGSCPVTTGRTSKVIAVPPSERSPWHLGHGDHPFPRYSLFVRLCLCVFCAAVVRNWLGRGADRAPEFLGGGGQSDGRRADCRECVVDRVHDRRDRANPAGLAHPLAPRRVLVGRARILLQLERAEIIGARHAVILERAGHELPRL